MTPDERKKKFDELLNIHKKELFKTIDLKTNIAPLLCVIHEDVYEFCEYMAKEKYNNTVKNNQYGNARSQADLYNNALSGILAETYTHFILSLVSVIPDEMIYQFDLERPHWTYPTEWNPPQKEYDIKIPFNNLHSIDFEIKSSTMTESINEFIKKKRHLICGHINDINEMVDTADYYFQIYFQVLDRDKDDKFLLKSFISEETKMYLVAGATKSLVYEKGTVEKIDKNQSTLYRMIDINKAVNITDICNDISNMYFSNMFTNYLAQNNLTIKKKNNK